LENEDTRWVLPGVLLLCHGIGDSVAVVSTEPNNRVTATDYAAEHQPESETPRASRSKAEIPLTGCTGHVGIGE